MIIRPAVVALLLGSVITSFMLLYASFHGVRILRYWDISSGSELQLTMERRTYLLSTIMGYVLSFQLASFFLFVFTVDDMHALFYGAMCAAGTLNVNAYGYPALLLKAGNALLAGIWLILNHADNRAFDYPLIRKKYVLLLIAAPLLLTEAIVQGAYFLSLRADVITSCCGSLFSPEAESVTSDIAALPAFPMQIAFFACNTFLIASGLICIFRREFPGAWYIFAVAGVSAFVVSVLALISVISLYFYELPTHHCPFCILQKEYWYSGYVFYFALLGMGTSASGAGALEPFRKNGSLAKIIPGIQKRLAVAAVLCSFVLVALSSYQMVVSNLRLSGD